MIKEYALQPELLSSEPVSRYLCEKFGYSRGRVIARYPKTWAKMVKDSLGDCKTMERHRIIERLNILENSALLPRHHDPLDEKKTWLENAIQEHTKRPFDAVIAQDNPHHDTDVICEADLDEEKELRWRSETQRRIERTAREMANCAKFLLRTAREILFIDPYFNPQEGHYKRPLRAFLQAADDRHASMPRATIEIHTGDKSNGIKDFFNEKCKEHLPHIIPRGMKIRLVRWDQKYLHNRYILTDRGGLSFSTGLREHDSLHHKYDDVYLLQEKLHK